MREIKASLLCRANCLSKYWKTRKSFFCYESAIESVWWPQSATFSPTEYRNLQPKTEEVLKSTVFYVCYHKTFDWVNRFIFYLKSGVPHVGPFKFSLILTSVRKYERDKWTNNSVLRQMISMILFLWKREYFNITLVYWELK